MSQSKPISLVVYGLTGSGKSTLGNTFIGKNHFIESKHLKSQTTETIGEYGIFDNQRVFVVDTPGLLDSDGNDQRHLNQMIQYIKRQQHIQAFVFVINFMNVKMDEGVIRLFQLMKQMYPNQKWYQHVGIAWTNYYTTLSNQTKLTSKTKEEQFKKFFKEKIAPEITQQELNAIPQIFIDSIDARKENSESRDMINFLMAWIAQLKPLSESLGNINNVKRDILKEEIETEKRTISDTTELNVRTIETALFERTKKTMYNGKILYSDWKEKIGSRKKERKVLPPPQPKVTTEYRNTEKIVPNGERKVCDEVKKWGSRRWGFCGPRKHRLEKGRIFQKKRFIKESRTVTTHFDGKVDYGNWKVVSDEIKEVFVRNYEEKRMA